MQSEYDSKYAEFLETLPPEEREAREKKKLPKKSKSRAAVVRFLFHFINPVILALRFITSKTV